MFWKVTILLLIMLFMFLSVHAKMVQIHGIVIDADSKESIPGATVMIDGTIKGASTDSDGHFSIKEVKYGKYMLRISSVGYSNKTAEVQLFGGQTDELVIALCRSPLELDGIVVTGTRTPRFVSDAPVRTQVVTKSSLEKKSASNIFEALEGEPGVRVEEQCQGCNFSVLRMQGLGADHTQILLDGQPVYSGLAAIYGLQQMSTADVEQIEIVKGAGSALYGSNAVAGAINIISSVPSGTKGSIGIEMGEHGTQMLDLTASTRKDNIGIFIFAQNNSQDEIDQTGDINAPDGVDNPDGWIDRVKATSENIGFNLFIDDIFVSDQIVFRGRSLYEKRDGGWLEGFENRFAPGTESIITDRISGEVSYKLWLNNGSDINADIVIAKHTRDATNDAFLSDYEETFGVLPKVDLLKPYIADETMILGNLSYVHNPTGKHTILTGIQLGHNKLDEKGMYVDFDLVEAYQSTSTKQAFDFGAYLQDEIKITDKVELVAGVRYDYHKSEDEFRGSGNVLIQELEPLQYNESAFNPRFSIKYNALKGLNIRGSVGTGFRVPYGFSEDLHLCSGSPRVYKGDNLVPEKSLSYSINADYYSSNLLGGINLYRTRLTDAIAYVDADETVTNMGYTYEWKNIDNAYVMGAEFDLSYSLTNNLAAGIRFEIFEGKYDNAREDWIGTDYEENSRNISRYPSTSGGLNIEYIPSTWDFIFSIDYKGKMYIDLTEPVDENDINIHDTENFVIIDTKVSKTFLGKYTIYAGVKNLGNYTQEEKHINDAAFMYAPVYGRIIYSGMQVSF